jgi:hypothetical protein
MAVYSALNFLQVSEDLGQVSGNSWTKEQVRQALRMTRD